MIFWYRVLFSLLCVTFPVFGKGKSRLTAEEMCDLSHTVPKTQQSVKETFSVVENTETSKEEGTEKSSGKNRKLTPEEMCDLSVTLHTYYPPERGYVGLDFDEDLEEDARWRRHRNHLFFPFLGEEHQDRLSQCFVVFTLPKGGAHLIYTIIELIAGKGEDNRLSSPAPMGFPIPLKEGSEVFFSPVLGSEYRLIMGKEEISKVAMIRDPRDLLVSQLYWIAASGQCPTSLEKWQTLSLDGQIRELLLWDSPQSIVSLTREMATCLNSKRTHISRFEDLIGEQGGGTRESQEASILSLAQYLGRSLSPVEAGLIGSQAFRLSGSLRKQQVGVFRYYFSKENLSLCQRLLGKEIQMLGYPDN